jgi:hypothetical protein
MRIAIAPHPQRFFQFVDLGLEAGMIAAKGARQHQTAHNAQRLAGEARAIAARSAASWRSATA